MKNLADEARNRLSDRRFAHVQGVVEIARELAARNNVSQQMAEQAAWLHDMFRELSTEELTRLAKDIGMALPAGDPVVWHGPICAARAKRDFGVSDEDVLAAVAFHTVGHPDMPPLAQVIYVADGIEPGRRYPGLEILREAARIDLPLAVACVADASLLYLIRKSLPIDMATVEMRNRIWMQMDEGIKIAYSRINQMTS